MTKPVGPQYPRAYRRRRVPVPTEDVEQRAVIVWAELRALREPALDLLFHVPNMGKRHVAFALKMRRAGLKPGVPDLMLPVARQGFHGLFIEMKRAAGGAVSKPQAAWMTRLRAEGYRVACCAGADEAISVLSDYLDVPA